MSRGHRNGLAIAAALAAFTACGGRTSPPPAAAPRAAAQPIAETPKPVLAATLDEARSLRRNGRLDEYERSLRLLGTADDAQLAHRALALLGLQQLEEKHLDEAYATLTRAADVYPEVAPFLRLRLIDIEEQRGNYANAAQLAARIIATNADTSAATIAKLRLPAEYAQAGDVASTDAAYRTAFALPIDELSEEQFETAGEGEPAGPRHADPHAPADGVSGRTIHRGHVRPAGGADGVAARHAVARRGPRPRGTARTERSLRPVAQPARSFGEAFS
jgi:tetratricopeptide (TPR) repeat protein